MVKAGTNKFMDTLDAMADDMTTKEPAGIVYSDVEAVSIQPFNVTSDYMSLFFTEKADYDKSKYQKVFNLHESNIHPFNFDMNYDIFIEEGEEPLTLLQN
jgi:hypothetical protein